VKRALLVLVFVLVTFAGCGSFEEGRSGEPDASLAGAADSGASDASGPGFCATFASPLGDTAFCRDFDDGRPALEGWDDATSTNGASVALDSTHVSPPASLVARIEPGSIDCSYARVARELGQLPIVSRVAFDVLIGGAGTSPADGASYFVIDTGGCGLIFGANEERGNVHVQTGIDDVSLAMLDHFPRAGTWAHVEATIRRGTNQLEVSVNGMPALSAGPATLPAGCLAVTSKLQIRPGMHCEPTSSSAREVRIDNVVVVASKI
jgi:hypothetical protein